MRPNKYAKVKFYNQDIDLMLGFDYDAITEYVMFYNDPESCRTDLDLACDLLSVQSANVVDFAVDDLYNVDIAAVIEKHAKSSNPDYTYDWAVGYVGMRESRPYEPVRTWVTGGTSSSFGEAAGHCQEQIVRLEHNEQQERYFHV